MFCDFRQFFALLTTKTIKKVPFGGGIRDIARKIKGEDVHLKVE